MGLLDRWRNKSRGETYASTGYKAELITETRNAIYAWNGQLYQSDVIRSCVRPKAKAVGKLVAKHIREGKDGVKVNPEPYMRFLLEEPNPYMSGQMLQEKLAVQLALNKNAFALITWDEFGYPNGIYPLPAYSVEAVTDKEGRLFLKFSLRGGKTLTRPYSEVIHLREDFNENDVFGDRPDEAIKSLMEILTATDQSIVNAVKNSAVIKWLLKFKSVLQPKDKELQVKEFVDKYLSIANEGGAAASDPRYDIEQVKQESYVPNAAQMKEATQRLYSFFNTNEKIVQSKFDENEWNAYYESEIEPFAMQIASEYTRKLFTRTERAHGNRVLFEASNLQYASMTTKLNLMQMVDRGALTPNEWRQVMNMAPVEGGDKPIRRLDTAVVNKMTAIADAYDRLKALMEGGENSAQTNSGKPIEPAAD